MKKILFWCLIIALTHLLTLWAKSFPNWIDSVYITYVYAKLNQLLFHAFNPFSFSVGDILYAIVVLLIIRKIIIIIKHRKRIVIQLVTLVAQFVAIFYLWFNFSWGLLNYRTPLDKTLEIPTQYDFVDLQSETERLIQQVNHLQQQAALNNQTIVIDKNLLDFNLSAQEGYENIRSILAFPIKNISNVKPSLYSRILTKMGFSGYFNPFTHENHVNTQVPAITLCMTSAHEIAHQMGYASESEANFLGYLAMINQSNLSYQYAANLFALRYCLREISFYGDFHTDFYFNQINEESKKNIKVIEDFWQNNKNITARWSNQFYGQFLKLNNQKEGMRSYHQFVNLLIGYHQKN